MNRQHIRLALLLSILFIGTTGVESQSAPKSAEKNEMKDRVFNLHADYIPSVAFLPDGRRIASAGRERVKIVDIESGKQLRTFKTSRGMGFFSVGYSPDGKLLAAGQARIAKSNTRTEGEMTLTTIFYHGEVLVWDAVTGVEKARLNQGNEPAWAIAFSPNGEYLAVATGPTPDQQDRNCEKECPTLGEVLLWDTREWKLIRRLQGGSAPIRSIAFSPDGRSLAGASGRLMTRRRSGVGAENPSEIFLWETATGKMQRRFPGHSGWVMSLAFSPNGQWLASSGREYSIKIWNAHTGDLRTTISGLIVDVNEVRARPDPPKSASGKLLQPPSIGIFSIAFTSDNERLVGAGDNSVLQLYDAASGRMLKQFAPQDWPIKKKGKIWVGQSHHRI